MLECHKKTLLNSHGLNISSLKRFAGLLKTSLTRNQWTVYSGSTSAKQQINQNTRCLRNVKEHLQISKCSSITNSKKLKSQTCTHTHSQLHTFPLSQLALVTSTNSLFCGCGFPCLHTSPNGHVGALSFVCTRGAPHGLRTHALVSKQPTSSHRHPWEYGSPIVASGNYQVKHHYIENARCCQVEFATKCLF